MDNKRSTERHPNLEHRKIVNLVNLEQETLESLSYHGSEKSIFIVKSVKGLKFKVCKIRLSITRDLTILGTIDCCKA